MKLNTTSFTIKVDFRIVSAALLLIIVGMLALWQPWSAPSAARKITVSGAATIQAVPDEFVFSPSFERSGTDAAAMKNDLNTFGTKLVSDLKKLGVADSSIKLDSSSYDGYYSYTPTDQQQTISLRATITVTSKDLVQKVQDYLAGTDAKGQLTAQAQFSDTKQKQLQSLARQDAIANARQEAEQTAQGLGAKLGKVLEVNDVSTPNFGCNGLGIICPMNSALAGQSADKASLPVTPGMNELQASVSVVFAIN